MNPRTMDLHAAFLHKRTSMLPKTQAVSKRRRLTDYEFGWIARRQEMGKSDQKNAPIAGQESENAVVVVGEPRSLRGDVRIHNTGENKIVLKELGLRGALAPVGKAAAAERSISVQVPISAVISPGQSQRVPLTLDLDFRTPPG